MKLLYYLFLLVLVSSVTSQSGVCSLPVDRSYCGSVSPELRYYYDRLYAKCIPFPYYCDGNENNFETISDCQASCLGNTSKACDSSPCLSEEFCFDNAAGGFCCAPGRKRRAVKDQCIINWCYNGARCFQVDSCQHYVCACAIGYTGDACARVQRACDSHLCQNGGTCDADSYNSYTCICPPCYTGYFCETSTSVCFNHHCQNGGVCIPDSGSCTTYSCSCPGCFTGTYCQEQIDACSNHLCQNEAVCSTVDSGTCTTYSCICSGCFTGTYCDTAINRCSNHRCQNGGLCFLDSSCTTFYCSCSACFTGTYCERAENGCYVNLCLNGGVCNTVYGSCSAFTCVCPTGYSGQLCGTASCEVFGDYEPCNSRGQCSYIDSKATCTCQAGFFGSRCESRSTSSCTFPMEPGDCSGAVSQRRYYYDILSSACTPFAYFCDGNANNFESLQKCQAHCEEPFKVCESTCGNGGRCIPDASSVSCFCPECLTGTNCSRKLFCMQASLGGSTY
ncbi:fibropellin-1-like [Anneissia japonica]|uniref:fibropellin-1-like n=1 Tax=Anneissia japonica TaxID=1529436 RepID=UPI0014259D1F|nr:fibropellin-1-like [Anneissia japonica]